MVRTGVVVLLSSLLCATQAFAGAVMESVTKDLRGSHADQKTVLRADAGKLRIDQGGAADASYMIFKNDTVYFVDPSQRSYTAIDREAIQRIADRINPALAQMRERMASLPPEQRKMMESMMPAGMPGGLPADPPVVRKTSRTATIAGRSCKYVEVLDGTTLTNELCVVSPGTLTGGQTVYDAATKMSALMEQLLTSLDAPWLQQATGRQVAEYGKIGGFPVASRSFENGKPATETKLQSAREEPLPAATFEVPSAYRRIDPMQGQ